MTRLLLAAATLVLTTPADAAVTLVDFTASPFEGLHSRFEVIVYFDRPGEGIDLRLFEIPKDGAESEVACWRAVDGGKKIASQQTVSNQQIAAGTCPSLPDDELEGGTVVVEILRSLPMARYRIKTTGADGVTEDSEIVDTRTFPAILTRRMASSSSGSVIPVHPGLARGDPEDINGVSGVRRVAVKARIQGREIEIEGAPVDNAGFAFGLLGPDGLVWTHTSTKPAMTYDGPPLVPGEYFWVIRSTDPETILTLPGHPQFVTPAP